MPDRRLTAPPIWLWLNLLSLDAPLVAVLWQSLLAQVLGVHVGVAERLTLCLAVWSVYLSDRLLDAVFQPASNGWEPLRKCFYRQHSTSMSIVCGVTTLAGCALALFRLDPLLIYPGGVLAIFVAIYLLVVHSRNTGLRTGWPRELAVAAMFSAGTFFPIIVFTHAWLQALACWFVFAVLCLVNCCLIETWEWQVNRGTPMPSQLAMKVELYVFPILLATALLCFTLSRLGWLSTRYGAAVILACALLHWMSCSRSSLSSALVPVAADFALCSPLIFLATGAFH